MQHTRLGRTGLSVSRLCLGTMTFGLQCDEDASVAILDRAFDAGVTFLDTADVYPVGGDRTTVGRTEEILGRWLRNRRDDVILATKCFGPMGSKPWDQGSSRKPRALDFDSRRIAVRIVAGEDFRDRPAGGEPGVAFKHNEPPGGELAVIGNARRHRDQCLQLGRRRAWPYQFGGLDRPARLQQIDGVGHSVAPRKGGALAHVDGSDNSRLRGLNSPRFRPRNVALTQRTEPPP